MSGVRAIDIDFCGTRNPVSGLLLLAGLLAAAASAFWYANVGTEIAALQSQASEMNRMLNKSPGRISSASRDSRETQQETRAANAVIGQMTIPWDLLFNEIEVSIDDDVALLAVQPDAANRNVRINGEARNLGSILLYARRLETSEIFGEVILHGHEVKTQDAQRPVQFVLSASWEGRK